VVTFRAKWVIVLGALVTTTGCAAGSGTASPSSSPGPSSLRVLRAEEIRSVSVLTAYQAIARLRPRWLQRRAMLNTNPNEGIVVAYLDGVRVGGAQSLERIQASSVVEIEYLNGPDATTRFGRGHSGGAILVRTR